MVDIDAYNYFLQFSELLLHSFLFDGDDWSSFWRPLMVHSRQSAAPTQQAFYELWLYPWIFALLLVGGAFAGVCFFLPIAAALDNKTTGAAAVCSK